jgi:hypothetical protein
LPSATRPHRARGGAPQARQAIAFVKSANVARRHLSLHDLALLAATIADLPVGKPSNSPPAANKDF